MTAEADIAAIDDGGANTAAEVRTALTGVLGRADAGGWVFDLDDPLTSTAGLDTGLGTWSIATTLQLVNSTSQQNRARSTTVLTNGSHFVVECEVQIPTDFTTGGTPSNRHIRIGAMPGSVSLTGGSTGQINGGIRADGQVYFEEDGVQGHPAGSYTIPAAGTWVSIQMVVTGGRASMWFDGVKVADAWIGAAGDLVGSGMRPYIVVHSDTTLTYKFRNLAAWSLGLPSDTTTPEDIDPLQRYLRARQPGETAHADDDFFDDNDHSAYTKLQVTGTVTAVEDGDLVLTYGSQTAGDVGGMVKPITSPSAPMTIEAGFTWLSRNANFYSMGLMMTDGVTDTDNCAVARYVHGNDQRIFKSAGTLTNYTGTVNTDAGGYSFLSSHIFMRLIWTAANTFEMAISPNGKHWIEPTASWSHTFSPSRWGVFVSAQGGGAGPSLLVCHYLRTSTTDLSV